VDTFLAGDEVYTDTVGFVLDDPTLIAPGQTVPSEYVSVGTRGMLFVNPVSDAALAAPEPFRQRTIDLADTFTAGGFRHDVAVAVIFFRYDGNDAIDPQTGESMLITDLISEIEAAVGN
jgi:hypothetical protein